MGEPSQAAIDELFAGRFAEGLTPGLVWGVVDHHTLVHHGALGSVSAGREQPPGSESVFRIASMSKSFTAAAVLLLRDRGQLRLDDPASTYVPALTDPAITIRSLLTMSAGLLTDDPWGDRQESLGDDQFGEFLAGGFTVGRAPGLGFEYSNLGYALLGRIVDALTGGHRAFVEAELLAPLGMHATRYDPGQVGPALVPGHVKRDRGWVELEPVPPGAFSAMGGLHSSLADLVRWVGGFVNAFGVTPDDHPLTKASRREMQQLQRLAFVDAMPAGPHGPTASAVGYGFGLFVEHDSALGALVSHAGGYPGYGARMVWHPSSGIGVITLSNGTYAGAYEQAMTAVKLLVRERGTRTPQPRLHGVDAWVARVTERLASFDPGGPEAWVDSELMADNVGLDIPDDERRAHLARLRAQVGPPQPASAPALYSRAMAHAAWMVPAERGRYEVEILLTPEARPRLQTLTVTAVPHPPAGALDRARAAFDGHVLPEPVSCRDGTIEFLATRDHTWWKLDVTADNAASTPHPLASYPRLRWLAEHLDHPAPGSEPATPPPTGERQG